MAALLFAQIVSWSLGFGRLHWLFGAFVAVVAASEWRRVAVRMLSEQSYAKAQSSHLFSGPQTWVFSEDGLRITTPVSDGSFEWAAFDRVLEGTRAFGLASGAVYFAMPFENGPERDALVSRVNAWIGA